MAEIERVNHGISRGRFRSVLFDFDGTLSLIRQGWRKILVPMMVETLGECNTGETRTQLTHVVADFVDRLTGKQTIYQMIQLGEEIKKRGGTPPDPVAYKHRYLERLNLHIRNRVNGLHSGEIAPEDFMVPKSLDLLRNLQRRELTLYLASGTDEVYVKKEAALLGLTPFFGDGYVAIENVKSAGGTAVGVASDEAGRRVVNAWKRDRLIQAGADLIIPDYRSQELLLDYLLNV